MVRRWGNEGEQWTGETNSAYVIEHSGTILQYLLIPVTADIYKRCLAFFMFHTKRLINTLRRDRKGGHRVQLLFEEKLGKIMQLCFGFSPIVVKSTNL